MLGLMMIERSSSKNETTNNRSIQLFILLVFIFMLFSCHARAIIGQKNIGLMLNSGLQEHKVDVNQDIIINQFQKSAQWKISLGRHDVKLAKFNYFENKDQNSFQFTKIGRYQVTLESIDRSSQGTVMKHTLIILVQ